MGRPWLRQASRSTRFKSVFRFLHAIGDALRVHRFLGQVVFRANVGSGGDEVIRLFVGLHGAVPGEVEESDAAAPGQVIAEGIDGFDELPLGGIGQRLDLEAEGVEFGFNALHVFDRRLEGAEIAIVVVLDADDERCAGFIGGVGCRSAERQRGEQDRKSAEHSHKLPLQSQGKDG